MIEVGCGELGREIKILAWLRQFDAEQPVRDWA